MKPILLTSKTVLCAFAAWVVVQSCIQAGPLDFLGLGNKGNNPAALPASVSALSEDQVVEGLKEALRKGVQQAVGRLGHGDAL